jgi:Leucine-rich repeat (LRR) protein
MELGKLTQLQFLILGDNQLVSDNTTNFPILTILTNFSTLQELDLGLNHMTGHFPFSIGCLYREIDYLRLGQNGLAGEIPPQIGNLTSLTLLGLEGNCFTGEIPSTIKMLQKLGRLSMGVNNLQGNLPIEIGQLKILGILAIDGNNLSGSIPNSIYSLQQLRYLYLEVNRLSGKIPAGLGKCVNLL